MKDLRRKSMQPLEENYAEPPPYTSRPPSDEISNLNPNPAGPPLGNVPSIEDLDFTPNPLDLPTTSECTAHLKLLHAFAKLRHDVGNSKGMYGIIVEKGDDDVRPNELEMGTQSGGGAHVSNPEITAVEAHTQETTTDSEAAALSERIRDKKWTVFVHKAVQRFEKWVNSLTSLHAASSIFLSPISTGVFGSGITTWGQHISRFPKEGDGLEMDSKSRLPPLDVLMVWHAYMLNPRVYLEDCIRFSRHALWRTAFPWQRIYESIDNETFEYTQQFTSTFEETTKCPWDPYKDEEVKSITCPQCSVATTVPWTQPPSKFDRAGMESYLTNDAGFVGKGFQHECSNCGLAITHEKLRVGSFIEDTHHLLMSYRPLPGTILSIWGEPELTGHGKNVGTHEPFFPCRVVEKNCAFTITQLRANMKTLTVEQLKNMFEKLMKSKDDVKAVNSEQHNPALIARGSRIAVRKLLSHYWDNSSVFGLDLVGAVLRQGTFVQKMHKLDWLHSPSLMSTTQRLIVKYHRFVRLAADAPKKTVVPTLDVDLAWVSYSLPKTTASSALDRNRLTNSLHSTPTN